jgi:hypothetical protein
VYGHKHIFSGLLSFLFHVSCVCPGGEIDHSGLWIGAVGTFRTDASNLRCGADGFPLDFTTHRDRGVPTIVYD